MVEGGRGGGSICLGPLPQPLLLTTNNQALLLKGPCAPQVTRDTTQDPWRRAPNFFNVIGGHLLSAGISKNEKKKFFFFFFFLIFPPPPPPPPEKNLRSKRTVYFGVLSKFCFSERPWVKKQGVLWGSSPGTISDSLWMSPNWPSGAKGDITCNFLAVGWCKKSTAKKYF